MSLAHFGSQATGHCEQKANLSPKHGVWILLVVISWTIFFVQPVQADVPIFPNIGYIGKGYNLAVGNPQASGSVDLGWGNDMYVIDVSRF
jgi:hypothetical protein